MKSIAELLIDEGKAEGITLGEARGKAEGKAEGRVEVVLKLLTLKFGDLSDETRARVSSASTEELDGFAERILFASTLEEVLG